MENDAGYDEDEPGKSAGTAGEVTGTANHRGHRGHRGKLGHSFVFHQAAKDSVLLANRRHTIELELLLKACSEIRDHGDGGADLLRDVVDEDLFAVREDVVEHRGSGCGDGDLLSGAEL